jgi:hypothetical protein
MNHLSSRCLLFHLAALACFHAGCGDQRTAAPPDSATSSGDADPALFGETDLESPDTGACACGDGSCDAECGETSATCAKDCTSAGCAPGDDKACDDKDPCTSDKCSPTGVCTHGAVLGACDDGDVCTKDDKCNNGKCEGNGKLNCDDGTACTTDTCDKALGCQHAPTTATCSDDNVCTTGDACDGGKCQGQGTLDCSDAEPCTDDLCDAKSGCVHPPNAATCTDGNACTDKDTCKGGKCLPGSATNCDDKNPCTDDACGMASGCTHTDNTKPCDDGSVCTKNTVCLAGACTTTEFLDCDDKKPCTDDPCDAKKGCQYVDNKAPCTDNDACTVPDVCNNGICKSGNKPNCDDANVCTNDACDKVLGCTHTPTKGPCDDGNACTLADACTEATCKGGTAKNCDDGNACTDDACDSKTGACSQTPNAAPCDDGDSCSAKDTCLEGKCGAGAKAACDDGLKDGGETDVDCGGKPACGGDACKVCSDGLKCKGAADCASGVCFGGLCAKAGCDDKVQNGGEIGVDCGGACKPCPTVLAVGTGVDKVWAAALVPGGAWKLAVLQGGASVDTAAVAFDAAGTGVAVLRYTKLDEANDQTLQWTAWKSGAWSPLAVIGKDVVTKARPALVPLGDGLFCAYHGLNSKHYTLELAGGAWSAPVTAGTDSIFGPVGPDLAALAGGVVALGFVDGGNLNHAAVRERSIAGKWSVVADLSGDLDIKVPITVVATAADTGPDLMALHVQSDTQLRYQIRIAGKWSQPQGISEAFTASPVAATAAGGGQVQVAFKGLDNKLYTVRWFGVAWGPVGVVVSPNPALASTPSMCKGVAGAEVELGYVDAGGAAWHVRMEKGAWGKAVKIGDGVGSVGVACTP